MAYDRFLIAPLEDGLDTSVKPWLIPDTAYERLNNAYVYRGRVRKRFGSYLMNPNVSVDVAQQSSRLRIALTGGACVGITDGVGDATGTVPGTIFKVGQMFSIGDVFYTVSVAGLPAVMLRTDATTTATYNTTTGVYIFVGAPINTQIYFYPAEPVMGITLYETTPINDEPTIAHDTQFAYQFAAGAWDRAGLGIWTGANSQFFASTTYQGATASDHYLYTVNYNAADGIQYWNGAAWATINPLTNAADTLNSARIILPFYNRLLALNTRETVTAAPQTYVNRCRFSAISIDAATAPTAVNAWRDDIGPGAKLVTAPTEEEIVSAALVKGHLIVFFEKSTWELVYTGNELQPFRFQQLNSELGSESTFSTVTFDKASLTVGNVGISACNGVNVERIDDKIPFEVFDINNVDEGPERVHGVRDFFAEMTYWTFPLKGTDYKWPNKVLTYNYLNGGWGMNDDSITAFGYYQSLFNVAPVAVQVQQPQVLAGNQEGFVFVVDAETTRNAPALQITNLTYVGSAVTILCVDHNLTTSDYITVENTQGSTGIDDSVYKVTTVVNDDEFTITVPGVGGAYTGGGTITRISVIDILTKQYNFYNQEGRNAYIPKVDFLVDTTTVGQIQTDCYASSTTVSLVTDGTTSGALLGTNILETSPYALVPFEDSQARVWHTVYFQGEGEVVQFRLYMNENQLFNRNIAFSDFQLHAMMIMAMKTSYRFQ